MGRAALLVAGAAALAVCGSVVYLSAAPIIAADFWWHLALGEVYAAEGPFLGSDPFSFTAKGAPQPHSWLFDLSLFGAWSALGFGGLRLAHGVGVLAILVLAGSCFHRESRSLAAAASATVFLAVLSWYRLAQLRPDLVSIAATLLLYRLLLEGGALPSWRRVAAAAGWMALWANLHTLFGVGLALLAAATFGAAVRDGIARAAGVAGGARAPRLAAAFGLCLLASLANPLGAGAHAAFFRARSDTELWRIGDEWAPFQPFGWTHDPGGMSWLAWISTDLLGAAFLLAAGWGALRLWRRRDADSLARVDPELFALGAASLVAMLAGVRFLWLAFLPLLCVLRALAPLPRWPRRELALAAVALALAAAFPRLGGAVERARHLPSGISDYLSLPWLGKGHRVEGVRFLAETGLEGRLWNHYASGGFLDFWLAPRLQTFIDGRLNVESEVLLDYFRIATLTPSESGEELPELLERYGIDVFFGVGAPTYVPPERARNYTTAHLEGRPEWLLVSRSVDHAIYLRRGQRNRPNLERVRSWYEREGIPFDPDTGLDVGAVVRAHPDWAVAHGMLPENHRELRAASGALDPDERYRALSQLGLVHLLLGDYERQIELDRRALALAPGAPATRGRLAYALIRLGRAREAGAASAALLALAPGDAQVQHLDAVARQLAEAGAGPLPERLATAIQRLSIASPAQVARLLGGFAKPRLEPYARRP